jgi:hypothetical protein
MKLTVNRAGRQYRGQLDFVDFQRRPVSRVLSAPSCDALIDALVFVTALAIDAQVPKDDWPPSVDAPVRYFAPWHPEIWPSRLLAMPEPGRAPRQPPHLSPPAMIVLGRLNRAALPGWGAGLLALTEIAWPAPPWSLQAGVTWGRGSASRLDEAARLDLAAAVARACIRVSGQFPVRLSVCHGVEAGLMRGAGKRSDRITYPETRATGWAALAVSEQVRVPVGTQLYVHGELGVLVPITRPYFDLDIPGQSQPVTLFRPPEAGLTAGLGLGLLLD